MPAPQRSTARLRGLVTALAGVAVIGSALVAPAAAEAAPPAPVTFTPRACASTPFVTNAKKKAYYRIPALAQNTANQLLAFVEKRDNGGTKDEGNFDIALRISNDGGCTWGAERIVADAGSSRVSNPVPIVDRETGDIILMTSVKREKLYLHVQRSNDGGKTWSSLGAGKIVRANPGKPDADYPANTLIASATAWKGGLTQPAHGLQLTKGSHKGRLLFAMGYVTDGWNGAYGIYSDDHGRTWHVGFDLRSPKKAVPLIEGEVAETPNGKVFITYRTKTYETPGKTRYSAISSDGGQSAPAFKLMGVKTTAVQGAVLGVSGFLLFSGPSTITSDKTIRRGLALWRSNDNGATWKAWGRLTGPKFNASYTDLVQVAPNHVAIIYEGGAKTWKEKIYVQQFSITKAPKATIANTKAPVVMGKVRVGTKLTVTKGTWDVDKPTYAYRWYVAGTLVSTKSSYTPKRADAGKKLKVQVTAKKTGYKAGKKYTATRTVAKT